MKKYVISFLLGALFMAGTPMVNAYGLSWPRPIDYYTVRGPEANATGNTWCVKHRHGSYGTAYFVQTESWVNYGGNCNGQWGRPTGYLKAQAVSYNLSGSVVRNSGLVSSSWNTWSVQADIQYVPEHNNPAAATYNYLAKSRSYNGWSWETDQYWEVP